ncbi:MAG: hypothetical protein AAFV53_19220 [Myxococcota bacterium]
MHHPFVSRALPILYFLILLFELIGLSWYFATHDVAPSGALSVLLGWVGLGSMIVMLVYSIARRSRALRRMMRLSYWLHLHIFLGLQGVLLIGFHCAHLFTRAAPIHWLNPGVLNFIAVVIVFFSGIFGRYLYAWLPRKISGEQMAEREVDEELANLDEPLPPAVEQLWGDAPGGRGFIAMIGADLRTRAALRAVSRMDLSARALALAKRKVRLMRQRAVLRSTQRLFRYWIVLHRPLAGAMYVLSLVHVALAYMFSPSLGT